MSRERHRIPLVSTALILIGAAVLIFELCHYRSANMNVNQKWLPATGTIITSLVSPLKNDSGGKDKTGFTPYFQYRYFVDGKEYISEKISQRTVIYKDEAAAQDFVSQFPAGQDMNIYYEKGNPSSSLLELPAYQINVISMAAAVVLIATGFITWRFLRI
ncbi:MAG: DUF3592 domain-containing protein [Candidatus Xenobiia bacterium LiM19]